MIATWEAGPHGEYLVLLCKGGEFNPHTDHYRLNGENHQKVVAILTYPVLEEARELVDPDDVRLCCRPAVRQYDGREDAEPGGIYLPLSQRQWAKLRNERGEGP